MHSLSIGPVGLAVDYVLVWGAFFLALVWLRVVVKSKPLAGYIENSLFGIFIAALAGARAGFVWRMWSQYHTDWVAILDIRDGGFLPEAGLLTGAIILIYRIYRKPESRGPSVKVIMLTAGCILPLYTGLNWVNRAERMPLPVVPDITGGSVSLAMFTDKPVVINVWATWCPPCRREMPVLAAAQQAYPDIHFIFLNQGESADGVNHFLTTESLSLNNVLLDTTGDVSEAFGVAVLPTTLFYSQDGKLLYRHVGGVSAASLDYALQKVADQQE